MERNPSDLKSLILLEGWSLHERIKSASNVSNTNVSSCIRSASMQLDAWSEVIAPGNREHFRKRLEWDGLTLEDAAWVVHPDTSHVPMNPPWWWLLEEIRNAAMNAEGMGFFDRCIDKYPFVHVWKPVAAWGLQTLRSRSASVSPHLQLSHSAWLDLVEALLERLCSITEKALWSLFSKRRSPGQILLAHLGDNSDGRGPMITKAYDAFVGDLLSSGYELLLAEFPVLGRLIAVVTDQWLRSSEMMLRRVAADRSQLEEHFSINSKLSLDSIQLGLSDPHRGGHVAAVLCFDKESSNRKVVYKPRTLLVEKAYQEVLEILNEASILPPLHSLKIVSRDGYGFMEWVEHRICTNHMEMSLFYTNAGRLLALLYLLGCTDCHHENLIASGEHLVLIDAETLLDVPMPSFSWQDSAYADAISPLQSALQGSVLRTGLLPHWLIIGARQKACIDVSALGIQPPLPELETFGWLGLNTDGMIFGKVKQACQLPTSLPVGLGSKECLTSFVSELCAGFVSQLEEVIKLKNNLLSIFERFRGLKRRLVIRPTRLYFAIQKQMLEPSALRNAVSHGLSLEKLSRSYLLNSDKPSKWPIFHAELLQMEELDIPFFENFVDSQEVPLPKGFESIPKLSNHVGLTAACRRLISLDDAEIYFQVQLIRGAIYARNTHLMSDSPKDVSIGAPGLKNYQAQDLISPVVYCHEAIRLAYELIGTAIRDRRGQPEWLGIDLSADGESFHFGLIGSSLYSGSSGIALLFARLGRETTGTDREFWMEQAWDCFEGLASLVETSSKDHLFRLLRDMPLGVAGTGGLLMALVFLHQVGIQKAERLASNLLEALNPDRILADEWFDVISGVSGLIGPLLLIGNRRAMKLAEVCGDLLLDRQLDNGGWSSTASAAMARRPPLTGFSHGSAGVAAALAKLAQYSGQIRFGEGAMRALAYERSVFSPKQENWPDFRGTNEPNDFMCSWCHGAPGILLSRLVIRSAGLEDDEINSEILTARCTSLRFLSNSAGRAQEVAHLCCGFFGLSSLLRIDSLESGIKLSPEVLSAESSLINRARLQGDYTYSRVDSGSVNLPGLFTGKAGVALALQESATTMYWMPYILSAGLL